MNHKVAYYFLFILIMTSFVTASDNSTNGNLSQETLCKIKLNQTIDLYNSCSADFQKGKNCNIITTIVNDNNKKLVEKNNALTEKVAVYKFGFQFCLIALVILGGYQFYRIYKMNKKNQEENG